ncbi:peroxysomal citrate synthase [Rhizoctonia solani AG-1 IA]|uniref:Peroxysomal citrate synthase n=1 Tax=Thanatephorus cucumeris (strain AG1-IA) TaxID=983506 RepID=L8WRA2_THACA|nr:peroxysomal citrate synthase [Rhizoctonia solani AG-1 IA]
MGKPIPHNMATESLTVRDERTGKTYSIPITDNTISATAFKAIKAPARPGERPENETERGLRVSDKGFLNTAVIQSEITYIDGDNGILELKGPSHSGYPIEQLAEHSTFLEVAYLLIYGSLPSKGRYESFEFEVLHHSITHVDVAGLFRAFRYDAHPMSILTSAFAALGSYYAEANPSLQGQNLYTKGDKASLAIMDKQIYRLIGKATTLANGIPCAAGARIYCSACWNVVHWLLIGRSILCDCVSTDTNRNEYIPLTLCNRAGCASLYGPLHGKSSGYMLRVCHAEQVFISGGANEAVIRMLISIGSPENVPAFLESVKKREKVLSGFGHRPILARLSFVGQPKKCSRSFRTGQDPLLETAMRLHDLAIKDEYFVKRKMHSRYHNQLTTFLRNRSGLIYRAMGFPLDFFPVLFAVPRVVGWLAHWRQMMLQPGGVKIWRPRQVYIGAGRRDFIPIDQRPTESDDDTDPKKVPSASVHSTGQTKRTALATYKGKAKL